MQTSLNNKKNTLSLIPINPKFKYLQPKIQKFEIISKKNSQ